MDMLTLAQMAVAARWWLNPPTYSHLHFDFEMYPDGRSFVLPELVGSESTLAAYEREAVTS